MKRRMARASLVRTIKISGVMAHFPVQFLGIIRLGDFG
jgi:hypothetical protein